VLAAGRARLAPAPSEGAAPPAARGSQRLFRRRATVAEGVGLPYVARSAAAREAVEVALEEGLHLLPRLEVVVLRTRMWLVATTRN
jgi:hypothetical protein